MEIVLAALVAAAVAVSVALLVQRPRSAQPANGRPPAPDPAGIAAPTGGPIASSEHIEDELRVRRSELTRLEERLRAKEGSIELQAQELNERERALDDRQRNVDHAREELKAAKRDQLRELERVAGLSAGQAKQIMMRELEDELRHDSARGPSRPARRRSLRPRLRLRRLRPARPPGVTRSRRSWWPGGRSLRGWRSGCGRRRARSSSRATSWTNASARWRTGGATSTTRARS